MKARQISPDESNGSMSGNTGSSESKSREERIALIAYYKAQDRGFGENGELDDWLAAEREVDQSTEAGAARADPG